MMMWQSKLTKSMVKHLTDEEQVDLFTQLDDAVASICEEFEIA